MATFRLYSQYSRSALISVDALDVLDAIDKINTYAGTSIKLVVESDFEHYAIAYNTRAYFMLARVGHDDDALDDEMFSFVG